jgi:hypothetical protein
MKKIIFVQLFIAASVVCGMAQLKVSEAGNVGIKLPNTTDVPLSSLSVGGVGASISTVSFTGNKSVILDVVSTTSSSRCGIRSKATGVVQYSSTYGIGGEALASSEVSQSYGIGVGGSASGYYRNYGVVGAISNSQSNGAGIVGTTSNSIFATPAGRYAGYFNGDIVVTGTINGVNLSNSDVSYKQNIAKLDAKNLSNKLLLLNPVSYNLKQQYVDGMEKGKAKQVPVYDETSEMFQKTHYGLVAQEVQELYPELVYTNGEGRLAVNYTELIPVLIEAVKGQQVQINQLQKKIGGAGLLRSGAQEEGMTDIADVAATGCKLYQNAPNPFSQNTQIQFYIPENIKKASLNIYNLQGKQLKQIPVQQRGESSQLISGSEFAAGIYLYALIADGQEVAVKRMILTE